MVDIQKKNKKKKPYSFSIFLSKSFQCELTVTQQQMAYDTGTG